MMLLNAPNEDEHTSAMKGAAFAAEIYVDSLVKLLQCRYSRDIQDDHKEQLDKVITAVATRAAFDLAPLYAEQAKGKLN